MATGIDYQGLPEAMKESCRANWDDLTWSEAITCTRYGVFGPNGPEDADEPAWKFYDDDSSYCDRSTWKWYQWATRGPYCTLQAIGRAGEGALQQTRDDVFKLILIQAALAGLVILGISYAAPGIANAFSGTGFQVGRRR